MDLKKLNYRRCVGVVALAALVVVCFQVFSISSESNKRTVDPAVENRVAIDRAVRDFFVRQAYLDKKSIEYHKAGAHRQGAGFHHSVAIEPIEGGAYPPFGYPPHQPNRHFDRGVEIEDYYFSLNQVRRMLSVEESFSLSLLSSASASSNATGAWSVNVSFSDHGRAYLSRLIDGGLNASGATMTDWTGNPVAAGETVAKMRCYLVADNRCYKNFVVNDFVLQEVAAPVLVADGLSQPEALQIVSWLGF